MAGTVAAAAGRARGRAATGGAAAERRQEGLVLVLLRDPIPTLYEVWTHSVSVWQCVAIRVLIRGEYQSCTALQHVLSLQNGRNDLRSSRCMQGL